MVQQLPLGTHIVQHYHGQTDNTAVSIEHIPNGVPKLTCFCCSLCVCVTVHNLLLHARRGSLFLVTVEG